MGRIGDKISGNTLPRSRCNSHQFTSFGIVALFEILPFPFYFRPFLTAGKREILADYALPAAVLIMSFFGSYVFREVKCTLKCYTYV